MEWAVRNCKLYLLGHPSFTLVVDHQSQVSILDRKTLDLVENPKLQCLKVRFSPYAIATIWRKVKHHFIPDALSRAPVNRPSSEDMEIKDIDSVHLRAMFANRIGALSEVDSAIDVTSGPDGRNQVDLLMNDLRTADKSYASYASLIDAVRTGFPTRRDRTDLAVRQYWSIRKQLSTNDGLVYFENRIIVPSNARRNVLAKLHASH